MSVVVVAALSVSVLAIACSSDGDVSQEDYDAAQAEVAAVQSQLSAKEGELSAKETELTALQGQVDAMAPSIISQVGQAQPASPAEALSDWDTEASVRAGVKLVATYDSSGSPAWDAAAHPDVFITSEGEGYGGYISETYKFSSTDTAYVYFDLSLDEAASQGFPVEPVYGTTSSYSIIERGNSEFSGLGYTRNLIFMIDGTSQQATRDAIAVLDDEFCC